MNVYLVRHTSVNVPKGVCYGYTDVPLGDSFYKEAQVVMGNLNLIEKELEGEWDAVYSSPLGRCCKLAEFCGFKEAILDKRIMEMNFGEWEMQRFNDIKDSRIEQWYADYINVKATGGESFKDQLERVAAFFNELKTKKYRNVLLFTHGGVLICSKIIASQTSLKDAFKNPDGYGSIIKVEL